MDIKGLRFFTKEICPYYHRFLHPKKDSGGVSVHRINESFPLKPSLVNSYGSTYLGVFQISALIGYSVTSQLCFYSVSRIGQIFFGRFLNFSQFFYLFFLLLLCFSLFSIKISQFFFFRKKITAFEVNSKIFDNKIIIDCVFLG